MPTHTLTTGGAASGLLHLVCCWGSSSAAGPSGWGAVPWAVHGGGGAAAASVDVERHGCEWDVSWVNVKGF